VQDRCGFLLFPLSFAFASYQADFCFFLAMHFGFVTRSSPASLKHPVFVLPAERMHKALTVPQESPSPAFSRPAAQTVSGVAITFFPKLAIRRTGLKPLAYSSPVFGDGVSSVRPLSSSPFFTSVCRGSLTVWLFLRDDLWLVSLGVRCC